MSAAQRLWALGWRVVVPCLCVAALTSSGCYALTLLTDGPPSPDAGAPSPEDAGRPLVDGGPPGLDAGPPPIDAGPPVVDGGPLGRDAGVDAGPAPWDDLGLTQRVRIIVDATGISGDELVDFPVPFSIPGTHPAHAGPSNLRVFDDDGTSRPLSLASFSPTVVLYWSPVDLTPGRVQGFWLYFDGAPETAAPAGAWADHVAVYHLDFASPPTFNYLDFSGTLADPVAVPTNFDGDEATDGVTGRALNLDGVDDHLVATNDADLDTGPGEVRTWSMWIRTAGKRQQPPDDALFEGMQLVQKEAGCAGESLDMLSGPAPETRAILSARDSTFTCPAAVFIDPLGADPTDGEWHLIAGVFDRRVAPDSVQIYVDGALVLTEVGSINGDELVENDAALMIGTNFNASDFFFQGDIDELRVRRGAPPPGWLELRVAAERDGAVSLGDIESR